MALKIGIVGMGGMGTFHFSAHQSNPDAEVVAICDVNPRRASGDWSDIAINIGSEAAQRDLTGVRSYTKAEDLFADPDVDVVDITLPTYLHAPNALKALKAGKHVICEKPMAINSREAKKMVDAAKKARRRLFVAHCIRFWPAYAKAREIIRSRGHGKVISACFRRVSAMPGWSWENWLQTPEKSGLVPLDLHIHDTDFILYTFGRPKAVTSHGAGLRKGRIDHILTSYDYGRDKVVTAEGAWEYAKGFPFEMTFAVAMEKATLALGHDGALTLHPLEGESRKIAVPEGDGYEHELRHFVKCLVAGRPSDVVSPESALESVKLVELEVKSILSGKRVAVRK